MTWLTPLTGLLAAAAVIPPLVALYFLKLRRKRRTISSTLLWSRSVEDLEANAPWQRLRPNLLFLLQLLVLVALAVAVAQPIAEGGGGQGRTALLIDRSGSMLATDDPNGDATRLDRAKAAAVARVETLLGGGWLGGGDAEVMVIAFDERGEVRAPFTSNARTAIEAIEAIEPSDATSLLKPALDLARAFATNVDPESGPNEVGDLSIELFSDGRLEDLATTVLRSNERLRFEPIGASDAPNLGFEIAAAERPADTPGSIAVFASVFNAGFEERLVRVAIAVDGVVQSVTPEPVRLPAARIDPATGVMEPGRGDVAFLPFEQPRDALIELSLRPADDLPDVLATDDRAAIVVPPPRRLEVLRVGESGGVLSMLLEGLPLARFESMSLARFDELASGDPASLGGFDVVVLDGVAPETLPPGRYLAFGAIAPLEGLDEFGTRDGVMVRSMQRGHEIFRNVNLDELVVATSRLVAPGADVRVLAESAGGPLVMSVDRGDLRLIQVAFDPLDSNWPLLRSFVNFTANAIEHLGSADDAAALAGLVPGDTLTATVRVGVAGATLATPDGGSVALVPDASGVVAWGPVRRAGVHELVWGEGDDARRRIAVNRFGLDEGRLDAADALRLGDERVAASRTAGGGIDLWPWLLGLGLTLLFAEWIVYQRRAAA
jgi:Ca-activated chloride channel family protein